MGRIGHDLLRPMSAGAGRTAREGDAMTQAERIKAARAAYEAELAPARAAYQGAVKER